MKKRLQIHLSTAVVMMIAAGMLIWANVVTRRHPKWGSKPFGSLTLRMEDFRRADLAEILTETCGWPYDAIRTPIILSKMSGSSGSSEVSAVAAPNAARIMIVYKGLLMNIATGFVILVGGWFVCEWWIRRRTMQKGK